MAKTSVDRIRKSHRKLNQSYGIYDDKTWERFGISYALSQVIFAIAENPSPIAKQLAQTLQIEKSTLSRLLAKLHKKKLIAYVASAEDARAKLIRLTEKGSKLLSQLNNYGDQITAKALGGMSQDEINQIEAALLKLGENLSGKRCL
jgi:DNA-binding MarR family transcriptional regulator